MEQLPLSRRDITALLKLGPGLATGGGSPDVGVVINGLASTSYLFTVDGTDASPDLESFLPFRCIKTLTPSRV